MRAQEVWFAHLRNEGVTSHSEAKACCRCSEINGLRGRETNTRKSKKVQVQMSFAHFVQKAETILFIDVIGGHPALLHHSCFSNYCECSGSNCWSLFWFAVSEH